MKLKDWAKKEGISYQTAYRWFKANNLPVKAYQSESGTIIVQDEDGSSPEHNMNRLSNSNSPDAMSHFLKKTVEFSKANGSIEDFAAYVIANFQLKINPAASDISLKYSKNKPSQNDVNKHFQQFIKPKPQLDKAALVNSFPENTEILKEVVENDPELKDLANINYTDPSIGSSIKNFVEEATSSAFNRPTPTSTVLASSANTTLGNAACTNYFTSGITSMDYTSLPVQYLSDVNINSVAPTLNGQTWTGETQSNAAVLRTAGASFQPTPRELQSFRNLTETQDISEEDESLGFVKKAKRGRPKRLVK